MSKKAIKQGDKSDTHPGMFADKWTREAIESIAIAIVLAFLFRAFEAEAFVIPTGSMAETLCGRHKDVWCPQCGYRYQAGANEGKDRRPWVSGDRQGRATKYFSVVSAAVCPMCRYSQEFNLRTGEGEFSVEPSNHRHESFTGDRILVNKFSYWIADPDRWDVIVFKWPNDAKQNYIKRLIGLPNEVVRIEGGDIFTYDNRNDDWSETGSGFPFHIARKDPDKMWSMLQVVHDTNFTPRRLVDANWPSRWQASSEGSHWIEETDEGAEENQRHYRYLCDGASEGDQWLRYWHIVPSVANWEDIEDGVSPNIPPPRLIDDFYAYNAHVHYSGASSQGSNRPPRPREPLTEDMGLHWVGDLAMETEVEIESDEGELLLELVEGGRKYTCRISIADGTAKLTINNGEGHFDASVDDEPLTELVGTSRLQGPGRYTVRFANCDDAMTLWIDGKLVDWDHEATYKSPAPILPKYTEQDPFDLAPARVGSNGAKMVVERLQVLRDIYYLAVNARSGRDDYDHVPNHETTIGFKRQRKIRRILSDPNQWGEGGLFDHRRQVNFPVGADEFLPMGDNSPQSFDGRLWGDPEGGFSPEGSGFEYGYKAGVVPRYLLTGKAFVVYWPHAWDLPGPVPAPIIPNFSRFRRVR